MYAVGEYVVHPGQGVCRVEDIVDVPTAAYKLMPVGQRRPMLISYPLEGEDRLRPILTREQAQELIDSYADIEADDYTDRSAALEEEHFKAQIKRGTCRDSVRVAKTFRRRIAEVRALNKKPPVVYERILKEAQTRSLSELAVALDTTPEDVAVLFAEVDPEAQSLN